MVDNHFIGVASLIFVILVVCVWAYRWPAVSKVLWIAFLLRSGFALFHLYIAPLPDSGSDAVSFELTAWEWGKNGFMEALGNYTGPSSKFISWIIALFYSVLGRSLLLAHSLSIFFGTGLVLLGWLLTRKLWDERCALKVSWVLALFPTLILYSAIIMRENYICFFLVLGLLGIVNWVREGGLSSLIVFTFGIVGATFFHGGMIIGLFVFSTFIFWWSLKKFITGLLNLKLQVFSTILILLTLIPIIGFLSGLISVPKIGDISKVTDSKVLILKAKKSTRSSGNLGDGASFPSWTVPNSSFELFYKIPIRMFYFLFSPFPWELKKLKHLIGSVDGLLYIILSYLIYLNRKEIWADPAARTIFFILLSYIFAFAIGTGNFGTGIRHRSKLVPLLIILSAPYLPYFYLKFNYKQFIIKNFSRDLLLKKK